MNFGDLFGEGEQIANFQDAPLANEQVELATEDNTVPSADKPAGSVATSPNKLTKPHTRKRKNIKLTINDLPVTMAIDKYSRHSFISKGLWQQMGEPDLAMMTYNQWNGNTVKRQGLWHTLTGKSMKYRIKWGELMGYFTANVKLNGKQYKLPLLVFDKPNTPHFLARSWVKGLELDGINASLMRVPVPVENTRKK